MRKLLDSIWRGFPIGTLLLWRSPADSGVVELGPYHLDVPEVSEAFWVIDGQQRVTSLVGVLSHDIGDLDPDFDLYFDLRRRRFVHRSRRGTPPWWVPVRETVSTTTLLAWVRTRGDELAPDELAAIDELGGALRDYTIPAYVVEHDDVDLLREVFDRVNSAGKRITRAEVFHALFANDADPGSARGVTEALRNEGFGHLDESRVVQSVLAVRGGDIQRDLHDEFRPGEQEARERWFDDTERALGRVIDVLRNEGIPHLLLVPSPLPVPVLAAIEHLHPSPDQWTRRLISRWLWRGWVHGFGRSGQTPALRKAVRLVNPAKEDPGAAPPLSEAVQHLLDLVPDDAPPRIVDEPFRTNTSHTRLALVALASLVPLDANGTPLDLSARLDEQGYDAINQVVLGNRSDLANRTFWPGPVDLVAVQDPEILGTHAITPDAALALRRGDHIGFLRERRATLNDLTDQFLRRKLELGALTRPPLTELVVDDEFEDDSDAPGELAAGR